MRQLKPTSPGQRQRTIADYSTITASEPQKSLTYGYKRRVGRAKAGRITVRHKGSGNKRLYRVIDFKQNKMDIPARVETIEYDPNRSSFIALVAYKDGDKRYILAEKNMKVGNTIITSENAPLEDGNRLPIGKIPPGYFVHNLEMQPGRGGQVAKSAGSFVKIMAHEGNATLITMPSSEVRRFPSTCLGTIGVLSKGEHNLLSYGKAGAKRWKGVRPTVRGSAMNPVDHPHGGGEGRQPIGLPYPKTPWGKHALGKKTRNRKKPSSVHIVSRRSKK